MKNHKLPSICLIASSKDFHKIEIALKAGIRWIQFREKNLPRKEILQYAYQIRDIAVKYNCLLTINDYVDIAIAVEADGVHIGQDDLPVEVVKKFFSGIIGLSTHNHEEAIDAQQRGVDYIGFGPIFYTKTKKDALTPRGLDMLSFILKSVKVPVLAIGGIKSENLYNIKEIGCSYLAVSSGILEGDIVKNVEKFFKIF